jgi:TetR/AcrR family transcriptional repressor of nem operon
MSEAQVGTTHPTRELLLDAGLRIAARDGLSHMTVDAVVAEAKVAKGTYYVHFENRTTYLIALYQRWHLLLMEEIYTAISGKPPGAARLRAACDAYLDACLAAQPIQALLVAARGESATAQVAANGSAEAAALIVDDFAALGFPHALAAANLFVSATVAAALRELDQGAADRAIRESLYQFAGALPEKSR